MTPFKSLEQLESEGWDSFQLDEQRVALKAGHDLSHIPAQWEAKQMEQQYYALRNGVDLAGIEPNLDWAETMAKREDGRAFNQLDPTLWCEKNGLGSLKWMKMSLYRHALRQGLDLANLDFNRWGYNQINEQRTALLSGFDLSVINPDKWPYSKMQELRLALQRGEQSSPSVEDSVRLGR